MPREGSLHLRCMKEVGKLISSTKLLLDCDCEILVVEKSCEFALISAFSARDAIHMNKNRATHRLFWLWRCCWSPSPIKQAVIGY